MHKMTNTNKSDAGLVKATEAIATMSVIWVNIIQPLRRPKIGGIR